jgi:hypothetical protein
MRTPRRAAIPAMAATSTRSNAGGATATAVAADKGARCCGVQNRVQHDCQHGSCTEGPDCAVQPHRSRQPPRIAADRHDQRCQQQRVDQQIPRHPPARGTAATRHRRHQDVVGVASGERGHPSCREEDLRTPAPDPVDRQPAHRRRHPHGQHAQPTVHEGTDPAFQGRGPADAAQGQSGHIDGPKQPHRPHRPRSASHPVIVLIQVQLSYHPRTPPLGETRC